MRTEVRTVTNTIPDREDRMGDAPGSRHKVTMVVRQLVTMLKNQKMMMTTNLFA